MVEVVRFAQGKVDGTRFVSQNPFDHDVLGGGEVY